MPLCFNNKALYAVCRRSNAGSCEASWVGVIVEGEKSYKLDPWASAVKLEYDKLFRYFGIRPFQELLPRVSQVFGEPLHLMKRGVIFGHRDYETILDAYKSGERIALVTGFMPSGKFHFGHKMVADQIIYYQKLGFEVFIVIADAEA
ncbi:MAG TPA: hypothetical protein EYP33_05430, partial [Pyrodictium sp.]|nr:hypothetical protein [Pyrodictium sp.]